MAEHCGALCPFRGCQDCPYPSARPLEGQLDLIDCQGIETAPGGATNTVAPGASPNTGGSTNG